MPENDITELQTLDIYQLTEEQYNDLASSSELDPNALYMTPALDVVTSVNGQTGAVTGLQEAPIEVTIATSGAVTQELEPNKIYHFTSDALTALTVSSTAPTEGRYEFDFISGATAPTVTVPSTWVMPNNFMVEPNGKYRLVVENGYCVANRWSDNNSPFTYVDINSGAFTLNTSEVTASNIYANIGTEVVSINFYAVKNKAAIDNNKRLRVCTISADTKQLIGGTYVNGFMPIRGSGACTIVAFNTWDNAIIEIWNTTGAQIPANTEFTGTIFILRTI